MGVSSSVLISPYFAIDFCEKQAIDEEGFLFFAKLTLFAKPHKNNVQKHTNVTY
jgi:hypothetical protein